MARSVPGPPIMARRAKSVLSCTLPHARFDAEIRLRDANRLSPASAPHLGYHTAHIHRACSGSMWRFVYCRLVFTVPEALHCTLRDGSSVPRSPAHRKNLEYQGAMGGTHMMHRQSDIALTSRPLHADRCRRAQSTRTSCRRSCCCASCCNVQNFRSLCDWFRTCLRRLLQTRTKYAHDDLRPLAELLLRIIQKRTHITPISQCTKTHELACLRFRRLLQTRTKYAHDDLRPLAELLLLRNILQRAHNNTKFPRAGVTVCDCFRRRLLQTRTRYAHEDLRPLAELCCCASFQSHECQLLQSV